MDKHLKDSLVQFVGSTHVGGWFTEMSIDLLPDRYSVFCMEIDSQVEDSINLNLTIPNLRVICQISENNQYTKLSETLTALAVEEGSKMLDKTNDLNYIDVLHMNTSDAFNEPQEIVRKINVQIDAIDKEFLESDLNDCSYTYLMEAIKDIQLRLIQEGVEEFYHNHGKEIRSALENR